MKRRRCILAPCLHLLSRSRHKGRKQAVLICCRLRRFLRHGVIYRHLCGLLQTIFCCRLDPCVKEHKGVEEKDGEIHQLQDELSLRRTAGGIQQDKPPLPLQKSPGGILQRVPSRRQMFNRVASWSRFVEDATGWDVAAAVPIIEAEANVDMSQLFLGQKFASGAYSRLYHGIYRNKAVAVKLSVPPQQDQELSLRLDRQFSQEVTLLSRLRHCNVIEFIGACKKPPVFCVITEYLPGGSLKAFLHKSGPRPLPLRLMTRIALDVARGMEYLHSQGVIHRDLKSDNLLMTDDLRIKVADFGVSCLETHRKSMKSFMGTYRWMAPEMIKQKPCSRKVDVYSFGIVLWELLTGQIPFADMTPIQAAFAICQQKARPPIPIHCPRELAKLMRLCWSSNPARRPEFCHIVEALQSFSKLQEMHHQIDSFIAFR